MSGFGSKFGSIDHLSYRGQTDKCLTINYMVP